MIINYRFWKIRRAAGPDKKFRADLWLKLTEEMETLKQTRPELSQRVQDDSVRSLGLERSRKAEPGLRQAQAVRVFFWQSPTARYATVALSLILALILSTGVYAYSSPEVNEAHALYPVKKGIERVEGRLARSPERRAGFQAKQMKRRLAEIERLQSKKLSFEKTLEELNKAEEEGLSNLENVTSAKVRGIMKQRIEKEADKRQKRLEEIQKVAPPAVNERLERIMQKRLEKLEERKRRMEEKTETKIEKMEERKGILPKKTINSSEQRSNGRKQWKNRPEETPVSKGLNQ